MLKVKCSSCGFENALGIKFCGECGKRLAEVAKPGAPPDPRGYTPKHLAEKILSSRTFPFFGLRLWGTNACGWSVR